MRKLLLAAAAALVIAAAPTWAEVTPEEQKALAAKSKLSVAAFKCSWLADRASYNEEYSRLFLLGYGAGIEFLEAVEAHKITDEVLHEHASVNFLWGLYGPSNDFRLGRTYEIAISEVNERVLLAEGTKDAETEAGLEFDRRNCRLLK